MDLLLKIAVDYQEVWLIAHLFALVVGLGGASYTDYLLVSFLKDLKIDKKEKEVISTMSVAVTFGVFLSLLSGIMLFIVDPIGYLDDPRFVAKLIIFFILAVNGFFLHRFLLPRLLKFNFKKDHFVIKRVVHLRHIGFILGTISAVSWYSVFLLGVISDLYLSLDQILLIYSTILFGCMCITLLLERKISKNN